jgi:hypothetical protein
MFKMSLVCFACSLFLKLCALLEVTPVSMYLFQEKIWIGEHDFETLEITEIGWIKEISTVLALQPEVEILSE